jgi:hypothetical protein
MEAISQKMVLYNFTFNSSIDIATSLVARDMRNWCSFPDRAGDYLFYFLQSTDWLWGPTNLLSNGSEETVKITISMSAVVA